MKTVIIGGGIAGMAIGSYLHRKGMEIVICEKQPAHSERGHAFLMHTEALSLLNELNAGSETEIPGRNIARFILRRPAGNEIKNVELDYWRCLKRCDLVSFLDALLPPNRIKRGRVFSHFICNQDKIVAAAFANGEIEYGDIFIGADGGNSKVREEIFGDIPLTPVTVKEIVGIACNPQIGAAYPDTFVKYQDNERGLAFGMIPTSENEFVWFMQYDPTMGELECGEAGQVEPSQIGAFCKKMLRKFPHDVKELLDSNDFTKTYIWNTKDFDLLSSFHHKNVVLLGDAAHLTLPFTSAGTTNAIIGAKTLSECLGHSENYEAAFRQYYQRRSRVIDEHISLGRNLKNIFLFPQKRRQDEAPLPFLGSTQQDKRKPLHNKMLQVSYFTDPICSTCWIIQPLLKKITLEYGHYLDVQYYMGGLLPSWTDYKGKIQSPLDAAKHWEEAGEFHDMPLDGDVWLEDPLSSSFPPSIAFKAAQMQGNEKALLFLRRIREMVFLEKKNIMKWRYISLAASEVGLDPVQLLKDYMYDAKVAFEQDLELAKSLQVTSFPTLIFSDWTGKSIRLKGYQQYQAFEKAILQFIPYAKKEEINPAPETLFKYFPSMVDKEFALLTNMLRKDALKVLQELNQRGYIEKVESKNGVLWRRKPES
jgi:2-polyprenyl-6-methoxyphenol hydroxylase-like FAD-dependent oxidoreductase/predicted DsbA family dithiol-disulfide isomerase